MLLTECAICPTGEASQQGVSELYSLSLTFDRERLKSVSARGAMPMSILLMRFSRSVMWTSRACARSARSANGRRTPTVRMRRSGWTSSSLEKKLMIVYINNFF